MAMPPGLRRHSGYPRDQQEWYVEPRWCVELMLDQLERDGEPFEGEVLDPCCGGGTIPDDPTAPASTPWLAAVNDASRLRAAPAGSRSGQRCGLLIEQRSLD
jgi:hypothetical protein